MRNKEIRESAIYDFRAFGLAIKKARKDAKLTRNVAAAMIPIDPRYLTNIENKGQHPGLDIFYALVTMFDLSVDEFFFPDKKPSKSTQRRQLDSLLDSLSDNDLIIVRAATKGIIEAKEERAANLTEKS
jgi:transcriptional regulator with XRE-family HTH domain